MTSQDVKRKLTAILSADVKGYSRLMGADEEGTLRTLTIYREAMTALILGHRGRVINAPGDALLAEFESVVDAVKSATEIQRELAKRNTELPSDRRMEYRIGVNLGDVIEDGEQILGDGVNIAARLESLSEAGGICISGTAYDQVENKLPLGYEYLGEQIKNKSDVEKTLEALRKAGLKYGGTFVKILNRRCRMDSIKVWKIGIAIILGLFPFISVVQAQTPFDVTECGPGPVTMVYQSNEITISGLEGKGIFFSNHENKAFDNCTFQVVQIARNIGGNRRSDSYWKVMDLDGDIIIVEVVVISPEKTMTFLHGMGKWKGIKGGAKGKTTAAGKPATPGTFQACSRYVGTFELPKQRIESPNTKNVLTNHFEFGKS